MTNKTRQTNCKRCGKVLHQLVKSISGVGDALIERLGGICSECITPEEAVELEKAVLDAMLRKYRG